MASGDTVFQRDGLAVVKDVEGRNPFGSDKYSGGVSGWDGFRVALVKGSGSDATELTDLVSASSGGTTSPFDVTKTYDVIIKEH
jgi:hypothetical protein